MRETGSIEAPNQDKERAMALSTLKYSVVPTESQIKEEITVCLLFETEIGLVLRIQEQILQKYWGSYWFTKNRYPFFR